MYLAVMQSFKCFLVKVSPLSINLQCSSTSPFESNRVLDSWEMAVNQTADPIGVGLMGSVLLESLLRICPVRPQPSDAVLPNASIVDS